MKPGHLSLDCDFLKGRNWNWLLLGSSNMFCKTFLVPGGSCSLKTYGLASEKNRILICVTSIILVICTECYESPEECVPYLSLSLVGGDAEARKAKGWSLVDCYEPIKLSIHVL